MFDEHIPAAFVGAARPIAVPAMLDRSGHVPEFAIDMDTCAGLPKLYCIAIRAADLFRDRIIREAGDPKGHVVVARAHAAKFKETADLVENFTDPAPCKSGMRVVVRAAIVFPEFRPLWHNRLPGVKTLAKLRWAWSGDERANRSFNQFSTSAVRVNVCPVIGVAAERIWRSQNTDVPDDSLSDIWFALVILPLPTAPSPN
jgi:hypothetical protein